jgi:DNA polymerase III subunit delta
VKLNARDADTFCARPDPACPAVLIYGPDDGVVRERARKVLESVLGSPPDKDRLTELTATDLKADPASLHDELTALSMFPGKRVVRLRETGETVAKLVAGALGDLAKGTLMPEALLLVEAGELPPRSPLRKAFESDRKAAAIACYADTGRSLQHVLREGLSEYGLKPEPDALDLLGTVLGEDRGVTRQELLKLALYKGALTGRPESAAVTVADVEACLIAPGEAAASSVIDALGAGDAAAVDVLVGRAFSAGTASVGLIRQAILYFQKLHLLTGRLNPGEDPVAAFNRIPGQRLHFSREAALRTHMRLWSAASLERALLALADAERQCKTTGLPDQAICHRTLLSLANHAARAAAAR